MSHSIALSVVVAVVGGPGPLRRCLTALCTQMDPHESEIIVPYDRWCDDVATLNGEFSQVRFHRISDDGITETPRVSIDRHRLYERRRAVGLSLARGAVVALTEDFAVPTPDWSRQVLAAHARAHPVIGGAIENGIDRPLNWALYYCDFGRYGRPFPAGPVSYVSDVNVSYKQPVLLATADVWRDAYQETTLHWYLKAHGYPLFLDPSPVVFQQRPTLPLAHAVRERAALGRAFAETRAATATWQRVLYACGTPVLPLLLLSRCMRHMLRQGRTVRQMATTLPLALILMTAYALGELSGYILFPKSTDPG